MVHVDFEGYIFGIYANVHLPIDEVISWQHPGIKKQKDSGEEGLPFTS